MSKIYDFPFSYNIVKRYVVFMFKRFYGEFIVVGRENIPTDCPVIFAPNHTNALMDALAIMEVIPRKMPVVFLARADIFKNKVAAKLLNFTKIMPAFRMRDGVENLGRNAEIFDRCVEVLVQNRALGIMPEGNQEIEKKIRPLVKGIFRVAFSAQQKIEKQPGVKIVPIGMDYGDIVKFGKHIIVSVGKPIELSDYMTEYNENPVTATNKIRNRLRDELCKLTLNMATESHYDCFETVVNVANTSVVNNLKLQNNTVFRFKARLKIADKLIYLENTEPDNFNRICAKCAEYESIKEKLNLRDWVFENAPFKKIDLFFESIRSLVLFPFFLMGFLVNFLPFLSPVYIRKYVFKSKYEGFFSSLQFGLGLLTFPIFYVLQTLLFYIISSSLWWVTVIFLFSQYPLGRIALNWNKTFKKLLAKYRFIKMRKTNPAILQQITDLREEIIEFIVG